VKKTLRLLDPTATATTSAATLAPPLSTLEARSLLFFWNAKPNGDAVLRGIEQGLRERGLSFSSELVKKDVAIAAASDALIEDVSRRMVASVGAVAD
jgi:hypothetical protein